VDFDLAMSCSWSKGFPSRDCRLKAIPEWYYYSLPL
jgi:hypothetical protein